MIEPKQCVAARGLLGWKQKDLSEAISSLGGELSVTAITAFEKGGSIRESNASLIVAAFENAEVQLIPENGGGAGVRLLKKSGDIDSGG
ncbi:MAG: transcriptional regulator [Pseudomonadota bacterium]